jgi:hypothetical protein
MRRCLESIARVWKGDITHMETFAASATVPPQRGNLAEIGTLAEQFNAEGKDIA